MEVVTTDEFAEWYLSLLEADKENVAERVKELEYFGVTAPFPLSSAIAGTKFPIRELRIQSKGKPLRVFYAFDPRRDAVLILGGDKTGDKQFYRRMIPRVEAIWSQYLKEQATGRH